MTGGNQGLGKAFAAALAQAGRQAIIVARDAARNAAAVRELTSQGLAVSALDADITADAGPVTRQAAEVLGSAWTSWSTTPGSRASTQGIRAGDRR